MSQIVSITTKDNFTLHGLLSTSKKKTKKIIIHFHGSAGNFYQNSFYPSLTNLYESLNIAFLSVNTRGSGVYDIEKGTKPKGAAVEIFEECLFDIDAWIDFAILQGFKEIILEGHSFGTNKI